MKRNTVGKKYVKSFTRRWSE